MNIHINLFPYSAPMVRDNGIKETCRVCLTDSEGSVLSLGVGFQDPMSARSFMDTLSGILERQCGCRTELKEYDLHGKLIGALLH